MWSFLYELSHPSAPAPVFENKKSNERDFVAFEKKSAFIVVIWRSCNLFTPVVSVGYIFVLTQNIFAALAEKKTFIGRKAKL